jgi:hypothetical protein
MGTRSHPAGLVQAALAYLTVSTGVSLYLFLARWGDVEAYGDVLREFKFKMEHLGSRTVAVNFAVVLSSLSALATLVVVIPEKFHF